jgi:hypothetical protein
MVKASVPVKQLQIVQQRKQNKINKLLERSILKPIAGMREKSRLIFMKTMSLFMLHISVEI